MSDEIVTGPDEWAARAADLERQLGEVEAQARERIVRAELKAEAVRAGMVDLDGLKLIDASGIKTNAAGEVEGAAALMRDLRRAKPCCSAAPPRLPPRPCRGRRYRKPSWRPR